MEKNPKLPFLDVWLKWKFDGSISHNLYTKPTHTNRYLNTHSHHPFFLFLLWLGRDNAEDLIRARFAQYHLEIDAFSSMRYIGIQTVCPPSSFKKLQTAITAELNNTAVRSPRNPQLVFATLKVCDGLEVDKAGKESISIQSGKAHQPQVDFLFTYTVGVKSMGTPC